MNRASINLTQRRASRSFSLGMPGTSSKASDPTRRGSGNNIITELALLKIKKQKAWVRSLVSNKFVSLLLVLMALWALFNVGIRTFYVDKKDDLVFDVINIVFYTFFNIEIAANVYSKEDYFHLPTMKQMTIVKETLWRTWFRRIQIGSFYFWLDSVSNFWLMVEVSFIYQHLAAAQRVGIRTYSAIYIQSGFDDHKTTAINQHPGYDSWSMFVKLGYILRAGAYAGRIIRVFRLIESGRFEIRNTIAWLMRCGRKVKDPNSSVGTGTSTPRNRRNINNTPNSRTGGGAASSGNSKAIGTKGGTQGLDDDGEITKSRLGSAMTELMNKRVVFLIIMLYFFIQFMTCIQYDYQPSMATQLVHSMAILNHSHPQEYNTSLLSNIHTVLLNTDIVSLSINDRIYYKNDHILQIRRIEELFTLQTISPNVTTKFVFDRKMDYDDEQSFTMLTTFWVLVVLVLGTYFMSSDVDTLLIRPIERLIDLVRKISDNPLGVEYKMLGEKEGFVAGMETTILLTTINRIGGLMQVGFGEAGATMIAKNLADSSGGTLNFMGGGTMIKSIFGFCDVRQFTDTTECLQEEVMLFVNRIAFILHGIVVQCSGAANKNIGDAFLLMWKVDDHMTISAVSHIADQALLAFCKTLIELSRYQRFICNFSAAAAERLTKRFPNYEVRIGSGLHVGWAIEGAIGSNRKIDASYLSPHVNFTEFLESSTKEYGVPLLFSEAFYRFLSPQAKKYCRQVDRIRRSEAEDVVGLFIYDFDMDIDWNDGPHRLREINPNPAPTTHHRDNYGRDNYGQRVFKREGAPRSGGGGMLMRQQSQSQGFSGMGKRSSYENLMDAALIGSSGKKSHPVRKGSHLGSHPMSTRNAGSRETGTSIRHGGSRQSESRPSVHIKRVSSHENRIENLVNQRSDSHHEVSIRSNTGHIDNVPSAGSSSKSNRPPQTSNLFSNNVANTGGTNGHANVVSAALMELSPSETPQRKMSESHKSDNSLPPLGVVLENVMKDSTGNTGNTTNSGTPSNGNIITAFTTNTNKTSNLFGSDNGSPVEGSSRHQKRENRSSTDTLNVDNGTSITIHGGGNVNITSHNNTTTHNPMITENASSVVTVTHANSRLHAVINGSGISANNSHTNSKNNSNSNSRSNSRPGSRNGSFGYGQGDFLISLEEGKKKEDGQPYGKKGMNTGDLSHSKGRSSISMNPAGGGGLQSSGGAGHKKPGGSKSHPAGGSAGYIRGINMSRQVDRSSMGPGGEILDNSSDEDDHEGDYVDTSLAPEINIAKYTVLVWESDHDLVAVRHLATESFRQQWEKGIQEYIAGDWEKARDIFHETVSLPGGKQDGPSQRLIQVIDDHGGSSPSNWPGYRMEDGGGH